jgi:hypothetical protein
LVPAGTLKADWEHFDFIFVDQGRVNVHTIRMRRFSKEEFDALARETEDRTQ